MTKLQILMVMLLMGVVAARNIHHQLRHHHHGEERLMEDDLTREAGTAEIDGMPIEKIRLINHMGKVPVNNILFFKTYKPCDLGYERDILGICREVWD